MTGLPVKLTVLYRRSLYRTYCRPKNPLNEQGFKTCRKKTALLIEKAKEYYESKLRDNLENPNRFFEEFNSLCRKINSKSPLAIEKDHGELVTDKLEIANSFNEKIVAMNKIILDSPQDISFETYETKETSLVFFPIDPK